MEITCCGYQVAHTFTPIAFHAETDPPITGKSCPWAGSHLIKESLSSQRASVTRKARLHPLAALMPSSHGREHWPALAVAVNP